MPDPTPSLWGDLSGLGDSPTALAQIALGAVLLLFGRRLFWLAIAVVGFGLGFVAADAYLGVDSGTWRWVVALLAGSVAALAAVFLRRVAVSLGGALIGGYSAAWYLALDGQSLQGWHWVVVGVAALVGFFVGRIVFELGLIVLSSLAGATLVMESIAVGPQASRWIFLVLVVLGAVVQSSTHRKKRN